MRATGPMNTPPSVTAGRISESIPSSVQIGPARPVKGSHCHWKPTNQISTSPRKKTGTDTPATEIAMIVRSIRRKSPASWGRWSVLRRSIRR